MKERKSRMQNQNSITFNKNNPLNNINNEAFDSAKDEENKGNEINEELTIKEEDN